MILLQKNILLIIEAHRVNNHAKLKSMYHCDLVLKNAQNIFFILDEVIDAEFEECN